MKSCILLLTFIIISLDLGSDIFAQDSNIHPYIGASANFLGISDAGWGIEIGAKYKFLYLSSEYGIYGVSAYNKSVFSNNEFVPEPVQLIYYLNDHHLTTSPEYFFAINVGVVYKDFLWLGYVVSFSHQRGVHPVSVSDSSFKWTDYTDIWYDVGPDIRIIGWDHVMFDIAYSNRRGIKSGLGYLF